MSEFERKYDAAIEELEATEIKRINYLPPMYRLYRKIGWKVRPPHYHGLLCAFIGQSVFFAGVTALFLLINAWTARFLSINTWQVLLEFATSRPFIFMTVQIGLTFGLWRSAFYAFGRRKWKLSKWIDL